ncbi:MAG: SDR family oxidoreductase [Anaerolineae bacterium]|jgi:NAD(P)-dependent dehydrogenase (short-subunit alcohol dehydrogenase family)
MNQSGSVELADVSQSIKGKTALVTGGTTGIGRAIVLRLASEGARVLTFGHDERTLQDALPQLQQAGEVYGLTADVTRNEDLLRVFQEVDSKLGGLDILVNNAAVGAGSILEGDYPQWEYVLRVNVLGYLACARYAIDRMKQKGGGDIVNIGSMSADVREEGSSIYVATKAAIQGFSEALRKEVSPGGIRVSLIQPGQTGSDMQATSPEEERQLQRNLEMLKAEDIADLVLFCLTRAQRTAVVSVDIRPLMQLI